MDCDMSILMTPTKPRVSHRRGYRLHPVNDGLVRTRTGRFDELGATPVPFWFDDPETGRSVPNRETVATERARTDGRPVDAPSAPANRSGVWVLESFDRFGNVSDRTVIRTTDMGDDRLPSAPVVRNNRSASAPKTATPNRSTTSRPRGTVSNSDVDRTIRATGYTGPINRTMRSAARDVIANNRSVAAYVRGNN